MKAFQWVRKSFYWIAGAVVHFFVLIILWSWGLGVLYWLMTSFCNFLGCNIAIGKILDSPAGAIFGVAVISAIYLQIRNPIDISRNEEKMD